MPSSGAAQYVKEPEQAENNERSLKPERLLEIKSRLKQAQFGYNRMDHHIYTQDVAALLADRQELCKVIEQLVGQTESHKARTLEVELENEHLKKALANGEEQIKVATDAAAEEQTKSDSSDA